MNRLNSILITCILAQAQSMLGQSVSYPLSHGSYWLYSIDDVAPLVVEISRDTLMPNGKQYTIVEGVELDFQRFEANLVYVYQPGLQDERLQYDFTASPGDTIVTYLIGDDTTTITLTSKDTVFVFGAWRPSWTFSSTVRYYADNFYRNTVIDSIGLYSHMAFARRFSLQGAILNGMTYGIVADVSFSPDIIPENLSLHQNYPNPFNSSTILSYTLSRQSNVSMEVHNSSGQLIWRSKQLSQSPGAHTFHFSSGGLPSGIYYYSLKTDLWESTRAMVLIK